AVVATFLVDPTAAGLTLAAFAAFLVYFGVYSRHHLVANTPAEVLPRVMEMIAQADVVKASDEDIAWLHPDEPVEDVMRRWIAAGPAMVVLT
ncbi:hypothetical protein PJI74_29665, partial [Mycobacterium kansasii]